MFFVAIMVKKEYHVHKEIRRENMSLPKDPVMLLSVVNTKLRDYYPNLEELVKVEGMSEEEIINKLKTINYHYNETRNQFV